MPITEEQMLRFAPVVMQSEVNCFIIPTDQPLIQKWLTLIGDKEYDAYLCKKEPGKWRSAEHVGHIKHVYQIEDLLLKSNAIMLKKEAIDMRLREFYKLHPGYYFSPDKYLNLDFVKYKGFSIYDRPFWGYEFIEQNSLDGCLIGRTKTIEGAKKAIDSLAIKGKRAKIYWFDVNYNHKYYEFDVVYTPDVQNRFRGIIKRSHFEDREENIIETNRYKGRIINFGESQFL